MSDPAVSDPSITAPDSGPIAEPECSIQRTLDVIGDRWTLLILRDLFRGVRRFGQLHGQAAVFSQPHLHLFHLQTNNVHHILFA